ncbi:MAG: hypothetical protein ACUVR8_06085 [Acidobacteriota bacterium]
MEVRQLTKHQEHVVKHVLGCQILGIYAQPEHLHFLLDIPYLWSVDADGSMSLVQDEEALAALDLPEDIRQALCAEAAALREQGRATTVQYFMHPPQAIGTLEDVTLYTVGDTTHMQVIGDADTLTGVWSGTSICLLT